LSFDAAGTGFGLAATLGAQVATLFVVNPPVPCSGEIDISPEALQEITARDNHAIIEALRRTVSAPKGASHFVQTGHPSNIIEHVAKDWSADLIVIGSHGRSGIGRILLGSVAEAVVWCASCPVLVVLLSPLPAIAKPGIVIVEFPFIIFINRV
jgi:nucleotide-binding universal stress UspA family protein